MGKLGLGDYPKTLDELVAAAKAGTSAEKGTWGYLAPSSAANSSYFDWFQFFQNEGANFLNEGLTANGFNNAAGLKGLTFASDMYCTYKVDSACWPIHAAATGRSVHTAVRR